MFICFTFILWFPGFCVDIGSTIQGDEPILHVERFGIGHPVVISNGYLFIDFKYITPPYVIERIGQAVTVNKIVVNCLYTNEIPNSFERKSSEFLGSDGRMHTITSPPHPASWIKGTADVHVSVLSNNLSFMTLFLPGARKPSLDSKEASLWRPRSMPVTAKINLEGFSFALLESLSAQNVDKSWETAKNLCPGWSLSAENTMRLVQNTKADPQLIERLRSEEALRKTQNTLSEVANIKVIQDLEVLNVAGFDWKLTVLFPNGLEFYVGRDMEIRDICFSTNAITVEAYRYDMQFPLPKTQRIRAALKLKATIKSIKTGQTVTTGITDLAGQSISVDDVKYQVIDIRADSQTVLIKNCVTGEKLLVAVLKK